MVLFFLEMFMGVTSRYLLFRLGIGPIEGIKESDKSLPYCSARRSFHLVP